MHRAKAGFLSILFSLAILPLSAAQAQTFTVLHGFTGQQDGSAPAASLTLDAAGNLYGTAYAGGKNTLYTCHYTGCGIVFKMSRRNSAWVLSPLNTFNVTDGLGPVAPVVFGPGDLLYGSTSEGGVLNCSNLGYPGCGVVYTLQPSATACRSVLCSWTENLIHQFSNLQTDGYYPAGNLAFDQAGNVYGTTAFGGERGDCLGYGCGTVFQLTRSGSGWVKTTLADYNFYDGDPSILYSGVIIDHAGNLYGTSESGGMNNGGQGTVYELTYSGSGWTTTILHNFSENGDGFAPVGGLIMDSAGNLYGTTPYGGSGGGGVVFKLSPSNGGWNYSIIANLGGVSGNGSVGSLAMDAAGNLYGTTYAEGAFQCDNVFKLTPSGGRWSFTDLYDFTCGNDGGYPIAGVTLDGSGNIFGTTSDDGPNNDCDGHGCGVVWEITQQQD
jgi:uncharacterized repeat protein (TIGR03803 family)